MQVLIVDDDDFALDMVEHALTRMGYSAVRASDGREAMRILALGEIRLVITDWDMPGMNGVELCRAIRREDLSGYVYIIMLTGREGRKQRMEGLYAGADDFLNKPLDPDELLVCLKTAERILSLETREVALFALAKLAESRDPETGAHIERVQNYARLIAQNLPTDVKKRYGIDDDYTRLLYQTSPLHDLGKVGIPDAVLLKPGKHTPEEFEVMKTHAAIGAQTLQAALRRFPNVRFLQMARDIAVTHHEHFDGSGYPHGLAGEQIPLCGRIVAVADVYDALTSRRVYKEMVSHEVARAIIVTDAGSHFDPEVVAGFLQAEPLINAVRERLRDDILTQKPAVSVPPRPTQDQLAVNPCKILIIEDDPITLNNLNELLSATGERIFATSSSEEAKKIIAEHAPRVIVSDWVMPRPDGIELCRHVRATSTQNPVHFIMLTANAEKSRLLEAYNAGVDDFISKPFDAEELLARVRAGLRATRLHDELVLKASGSQALNAQLATMNSRLERLSITDELTGLFNRRHAMLCLEEQWAFSNRYSRPISVAVLDIDHFKKINDTHGHDAGDVVLRAVAEIVREGTRGTDMVCRIGGEEFLVIFPQETLQQAYTCAERWRQAIEQRAFAAQDSSIHATVSIGISTRTPHMKGFLDLLKVADQALYSAKHGGRNVICTSEHLENSTRTAPTTLGSLTDNQMQTTTPPIDMASVIARCGGDPEFAKAVISRFIAQAPAEVARLGDAVSQANGETVTRVAHSLKSMAAYISANVASELAREIEELGRAQKLPETAPLHLRLRAEVERVIGWIEQSRSVPIAKCA